MKVFKKIVSILLVINLIFYPLSPTWVFAESEGSGEETLVSPTPATEEQTTAQEEPTTTPTPSAGSGQAPEETQTTNNEVTPTPTPSASSGQALPSSSITSGDANSGSTTETTTNTTNCSQEGSLEVNGCGCGTETQVEGSGGAISTDNQGTVTEGTSSEAGTGENSIEGSSGDALIDSGDATSSAITKNEINETIVKLENKKDDGGETEGEESGTTNNSGGTEGTLSVETKNEANLDADTNSQSETGLNNIEDTIGNALINTGDAYSIADILNILNLNVVGSAFEIKFINITEENGNINLFEIWKKLCEKKVVEGSADLIQLYPEPVEGLNLEVSNNNQANLDNKVTVTAGTGENQEKDINGDGIIDTGDAIAAANVVNFINTNIVGARFFLGVFNILGNLTGNIILPPKEFFYPTGGSVNPNTIFNNQNYADLIGKVNVTADTGNNQTLNVSGDSLIETGKAEAIANNFNLVNQNLALSNWLALLINNFGLFSGKISGWSTGDSQEDLPKETTLFSQGMENNNSGEASAMGVNDDESQGIAPQTSALIENKNMAKVNNEIEVTAKTGGNEMEEVNGKGSIFTGNATALANLFNFVNTNILGGQWFFGLFNIFGKFNGNFVFAHPDITISISNGVDQVTEGQEVVYTVLYQNIGDDETKETTLELNLPLGVSYLSDTSGVTPQFTGSTYIYKFGSLAPGEAGGFNLKIKVNPGFNGLTSLGNKNLLAKIIRPVYAAEKELNVAVKISNLTEEYNNNNNSASDVDVVKEEIVTSQANASVNTSGSQTFNQPKLEIFSWNNAAEFVYQGDTVTYQLKIRNIGDGPAYNVLVRQRLYNGNPKADGYFEWNLGTIEQGKGKKIDFGLSLRGNLPLGYYHTVASAQGQDGGGNFYYSNSAESIFQLIAREETYFPEIIEVAQAKEKEKVLGEKTASCPPLIEKKEYLPYVLAGLLAICWFYELQRRKRLEKELKILK